MHDPKSDQDIRLARMEKQLRLFQIILVIGGAVLAATIYVALDAQVRSHGSREILRVRGIIVEDETGHDRILIGAPVPKSRERKRQDSAVGLVLLSENGIDRAAFGAPAPDPQSEGNIRRRIGAGAGLFLNDQAGNERGGFAVLDNDSRVVLGLDYPEGVAEALTLAVIPDEGASFSLHDVQKHVRAAFVERSDSAAKLYGVSFHDHSRIDLGILRLSPYAFKQLRVGATQKDLTAALDNMKP
jgi:hypothetical protein